MKEIEANNQIEISIPVDGDVHTMCIDLPDDEYMRNTLRAHFNNPETKKRLLELIPAYNFSEEYFEKYPVKISKSLSAMSNLMNELTTGEKTIHEFKNHLAGIFIDMATWDLVYVKEELLGPWLDIIEAFTSGINQCDDPGQFQVLHSTCANDLVELVRDWKSKE